MSAVSPNIAKKLADAEPHVIAGLDAYRAALGKRQDWHRAVAAAIKAALAARPPASALDTGNAADVDLIADGDLTKLPDAAEQRAALAAEERERAEMYDMPPACQ